MIIHKVYIKKKYRKSVIYVLIFFTNSKILILCYSFC